MVILSTGYSSATKARRRTRADGIMGVPGDDGTLIYATERASNVCLAYYRSCFNHLFCLGRLLQIQPMDDITWSMSIRWDVVR